MFSGALDCVVRRLGVGWAHLFFPLGYGRLARDGVREKLSDPDLGRAGGHIRLRLRQQLRSKRKKRRGCNSCQGSLLVKEGSAGRRLVRRGCGLAPLWSCDWGEKGFLDEVGHSTLDGAQGESVSAEGVGEN